MSFRHQEFVAGPMGGQYTAQIDSHPIDTNRVIHEGRKSTPIAYPEDEEDQKFRRYKTDFITYQTIRSETKQENWGMIVRIVSWILIIYAIVFFVIDTIGLGYSLFSENSQDFMMTDKETLIFIGMSDTAMKIVSLISDVLIFLQGFYGIRTVKRNSQEAIKFLITLTIWFLVIHIVLVVVKLMISASYVDNYNWQSSEQQEHMSAEDIEKMETFVYGLIIATFFLS